MLKQFLGFSLIGISNGVVNFVVYNGVLLLLGRLGLFPDTDYLIALVCGFIVSVFWSFCLNRKFVFNSEEARSIPWQKALAKMYITYAATGIGLSAVLSGIWIGVLGLPKEIVTILNDIIGFPVTFLLSKFWSFKK